MWKENIRKNIKALGHMYLKGGIVLNVVRLRLGERYIVFGREVRFIKVTPKGYNFLDESTNCCVLRRHVYETKKSISQRENGSHTDGTVKVRVASLMRISECCAG